MVEKSTMDAHNQGDLFSIEVNHSSRTHPIISVGCFSLGGSTYEEW
jgi:hypothetical protein